MTRDLRGVLVTRLRPLVERFVDDVASMIETRLEEQLAELGEAFASTETVMDGAARRHDVRGKGRVDRAAAQPRSRRVDDSDQSPRSAQVDTGSGAAAAASADTKPLSDRALQQGQDLPPSTSSSSSSASRRNCGCGARGPHSRRCQLLGTDLLNSKPTASTAPVDRDSSAAVASTPAPSPLSSPEGLAAHRERQAAVKAHAAQREAAKQAEREKRSQKFKRPRAQRSAEPDVQRLAPGYVSTFEF